ncbi:MAG TPA: endolytic transglycosylase MltG [Geodermatophilus sp.]|nr:endolytic transglycosylase MltG [Geodermatophilus sp.]
MTGPTPSGRRGRHARPDTGGVPVSGASDVRAPRPGRRAAGVIDRGAQASGGDAPRHGRHADATGPLPGADGGKPDPAPWAPSAEHPTSEHPSAPLPPLPPGAWSRLQRRSDADPGDAETVAQPILPPVTGARSADADGDPADPADDEADETGGLEVLGTSVEEEPRRRRRRHEDVVEPYDEDRPDEAEDGDVPGHGGGGRAARRARRRRRRPLAVVLALVVLAGLVAGIVFGGKALLNLVNPASEDYAGQGSGSVEVRVGVGDTLSDIARALVDAGVIASVGPFVEAAEADPAAMGIQPGVYAMRERMSGDAALDLLLDPATRLFSRVTVPEGFTVQATLQRLAEGTDTPIEELQAAAADLAALGLPAYANGQLEGFLFPATYDFQPDDTAVDMLRAMVQQFTETATRIQLEQRAAATGRSPYEIVTVASMVQSETRLDEERADVAQVIYNRLGQGVPLGIDATLAYGLGKNGNDLTVTDLQTDSPYNTRTRAGLPPTPISAPGEASLEAALAPTTGNLLYYVLESSDGRHFFTADYAEFQAARERCAAAGLGCGG